MNQAFFKNTSGQEPNEIVAIYIEENSHSINFKALWLKSMIAGLFLLAFSLPAYMQQADSIVVLDEDVVIEDSPEPYIEPTETMIIENGDTVRIKIGKKAIRIVEKGANTSVEIDDYNKIENQEEKNEPASSPKFKGHWAGVELGLNNFMDINNSLSRSGASDFMDLNTGKSINLNLNFLQYSLGLGTSRIGLLTGMGFEFSNYRFDGDNSIQKNSINRNIESKPFDTNLAKSKLTTTYLTVPLLLEGQLFGKDRSDRMYISAGLIGGLKIGSHTKVVYQENGRKQKDKVRDDFNLSSFRYGFTARVGYKALNLYANYYASSLFEKNKGPELYPVAAGVTFVF